MYENVCEGKEKQMIYLDNCATTKPYKEVIDSFQKTAHIYFANPSSIHELGGTVDELQDKARQQIANLLEVNKNEIIFTSGGTEGNNLAIKGIAFQHKERGKHIITTEIEHPAVYETCKALEQFGFSVTYLPVNEQGLISLIDLEKAMTDETILVSVMHVNNEIGAIQPVEEIGAIVKKYPKAFFHVDAVQGLGKVPLSIHKSNIDLCTFSGHKIHGLKGTGVLYVKEGTSLFPLSHGGKQEKAIRSGTENVAGNVAFAKALRLIKEVESKKKLDLIKLQQFLHEQFSQIEGVTINSTLDGAPHILNVSVPGLKPEVVIHALYEKGFIISTQSACASKHFEPSRVLLACGKSEQVASSGLRISLSYDTTKEELKQFVEQFEQVVKQLKTMME